MVGSLLAMVRGCHEYVQYTFICLYILILVFVRKFHSIILFMLIVCSTHQYSKRILNILILEFIHETNTGILFTLIARGVRIYQNVRAL